MTVKLILMLGLITASCLASTDYAYDDYEEIPESSSDVSEVKSTTSPSIILEDEFEQQKHENDVIREQLEVMSATFRKTINKMKMKHKKIEMVFLVDSSSSVGKENFLNEISFVKRLLSDFNVSFNYTRVALITFSSRSKIIVHIDQISNASTNNDKCMLLNHQIPNVTYSGGGTNTYSALLKAKEIFESSQRMNSKKVLILITDGFSNGRNPLPIAQELKMSGVVVFTVGIISGHYDELRSISSKPAANYNYMLKSFSLFESLARKALHTDYKVGVILPVETPSLCDTLCTKNGTESCCVDSAQCACGFHSGHYSCICNPGFYGTGIQPNGCDLCPNGTFWNSWNSCFNCPDINHETKVSPALSINDCVCKSGYRETQKNRCEPIKCPLLPVPDNGYFVDSSSCLNNVNTACGARCNSGYQLVGSSIRLCQEDGTWSGHETECVLKTCPALVIPLFGIALCKNQDLNMTIDYSPRNETFMKDYSADVQKLTENFSIDTECQFSCAFGFYLVGSSKRHCLPLSKWDGLQASCKQILCHPLPSIPFGSYNYEECEESKSPYGTNCTLTCQEGFEIKGPSSKTCGGTRNGAWSQKSKVPRCVDIEPPKLVCPKNYTIELKDKSFVLLSSFEPLQSVEDNSGGNISIWVKPALKKEEGTKMYAGNYSFTYIAVDEFKNKAKCNFTISIVDKTPPVFDNCIMNQSFFVLTKNNTEQMIEWEEPSAYDNVDDKNVTVTSNLQFGNFSTGKYIVNYTATDQSFNAKVCSINVTVEERKCDEPQPPEHGFRVCAKNLTNTWCDFRCNFGYGFTVGDSENVVLSCDNKEKLWSSETVPECSLIEQPKSVEEILTISVNSDDLSCDEIAKNQDELLRDIKEELCGSQDCEITTEVPGCIDENANAGANDSSFYSIVKRDTETKQVKKIPMKAKPNEKVEIYVKISKNLHMWKPNSTKSENVKKVKEELKKVNASEKLKKRLRNMNVDLTVLKLDDLVNCNPGSISKKLTCVQCQRGAFQEGNACKPCSLGSFNNLMGQTSCFPCPLFHSTRKIGTKLESDCRGLCPPGHFARMKAPKNLNTTGVLKTLMPFCKSCGLGEYQSEYDQTICNKCPGNMTSERGSTSLDGCYTKSVTSCSDLTCGSNGRCISSGEFYTCECQDGFFGQNCELMQNLCSKAFSPCFNGGSCKITNGSVSCECSTGFLGEFCEIVSEPCSNKNCLNGANCIEISDKAFCDCLPGYKGDSCEHRIPQDFCETSPCEYGATCVNLDDDFECKCGTGNIGKRCHLAACDYKPCPEQAICVNQNHERATIESFYCKCPIGRKGHFCDAIDNPCDSEPCKNNGQCVSKALRLNVTSVEDDSIYSQFSCQCPPFFYGENCETFTTPDFSFDFEHSSVSNYVKLEGPSYDLTEISFCAWIQTNDHFNYGSLISYATTEIDNAFTFTDYNGFVLYINGENVITDIKIIDNIWHFICVSWTMEEGNYEIYLDGTLNAQGQNLSRGNAIKGSGIFIVGQEQDSFGGGFSESESFVGKISFLDFWNRKLNGTEVNEFYRTCGPYAGNLYSWTDLKFKTVGTIKIDQTEFCKPCAKNLSIDNSEIIYGDQTAFVQCNIGFQLVGTPFVFCLRTSKWELSKLPSCKVVKCSAVKTPANGRLFLSKISFNGQAKFTCDDGFTLIGNETITCLANGNWSATVPTCKSIYDCPALERQNHAVLTYASDSGVIDGKSESYPIGTFVEIKCDEGFEIKVENMISCIEPGIWDDEIEDCQPIDNKLSSTPIQFWKDFKEFLFNSCNKTLEDKPKLCQQYTSEFKADISSFELPETPDFEGMDNKLSTALTAISNAENFISTSVGNFMTRLIASEDTSKMDSYRFVLCLYIDLVLIHLETSEENNTSEGTSNENINQKIMKLLKEIVSQIYRNHLDKIKTT